MTAPSPDHLRLDADQLNAFLGRAFPDSPPDLRTKVAEVRPGFVRMALTTRPDHMRPGNLVSGPTQMGMADAAAYALVIAHIGDEPMAVTTSLSMHFLRGCPPGIVFADGVLLRLGRRIATCDVRIWTDRPERPVSHAQVAYALPHR